MIYPPKMPWLIQQFFPKFLWRMPATIPPTLYLTFDDGPIPDITPWILEQLEQYQAKATFFCVGDNIRKYPAIFEQVKAAGHTIGNHTYHHLDGWKTSTADYLQNVADCQQLTQSNLFRPPYGKITPRQAAALFEQYKIVLWEITTWDFEASLSANDCTQKIIKNATNGSIILLHDNVKSWNRLKETLPAILEHYTKAGFSFGALDAAIVVDPK